MTDQIIALAHEGRIYYWLPGITTHSGGRWIARAGDLEEELTRLEGNLNVRTNWWAGTVDAEQLVLVRPQRPRTVAYRLTDPTTESVRFPAEFTPEQWQERLGAGGEDSPEYALYDAVTEPVPDVVTVHEGPWLRADGPPPPADGRAWFASLPSELSRHRALLHLFPGELGGFREHLAARLKEIPNVDGVYTSSGFSVSVQVPYDPPRFAWKGRLLSSGKRSKREGREVQQLHRRFEEFRPPDRVAGVNRADAAARWDALVEEWVALITEMATARPCSACNGTGITAWKDGKP